jgi:hypothetical protein
MLLSGYNLHRPNLAAINPIRDDDHMTGAAQQSSGGWRRIIGPSAGLFVLPVDNETAAEELDGFGHLIHVNASKPTKTENLGRSRTLLPNLRGEFGLPARAF